MSGKNQIDGGAFQDMEGNTLAFGFITMQLSQECSETVDPGIVGSANTITIPLNAQGNIAGTVSVWPNNQLTPSTSFYTVNAYTYQGVQAWSSPQNVTVPSTPSPYNVGNWSV
jgi:hypothetical protein